MNSWLPADYTNTYIAEHTLVSKSMHTAQVIRVIAITNGRYKTRKHANNAALDDPKSYKIELTIIKQQKESTGWRYLHLQRLELPHGALDIHDACCCATDLHDVEVLIP